MHFCSCKNTTFITAVVMHGTLVTYCCKIIKEKRYIFRQENCHTHTHTESTNCADSNWLIVGSQDHLTHLTPVHRQKQARASQFTWLRQGVSHSQTPPIPLFYLRYAHVSVYLREHSSLQQFCRRFRWQYHTHVTHSRFTNAELTRYDTELAHVAFCQKFIVSLHFALGYGC